jgi:hypothetical protein
VEADLGPAETQVLHFSEVGVPAAIVLSRPQNGTEPGALLVQSVVFVPLRFAADNVRQHEL